MSTTETEQRSIADAAGPVFAAARVALAAPEGPGVDVTILLRREDSTASILAAVERGLAALRQGQSVTFRYVD